jgi:hypothetical protein
MRKFRVGYAMPVLVISMIWAPDTRVAASAQAKSRSKGDNPLVHIVAASFGDQLSKKTCNPDLSLCEGLAMCRFTVGEMCKVESKVKNLEVTWDCGPGTSKKARAAAQGTEISLECKK